MSAGRCEEVCRLTRVHGAERGGDALLQEAQKDPDLSPATRVYCRREKKAEVRRKINREDMAAPEGGVTYWLREIHVGRPLICDSSDDESGEASPDEDAARRPGRASRWALLTATLMEGVYRTLTQELRALPASLQQEVEAAARYRTRRRTRRQRTRYLRPLHASPQEEVEGAGRRRKLETTQLRGWWGHVGVPQLMNPAPSLCPLHRHDARGEGAEGPST